MPLILESSYTTLDAVFPIIGRVGCLNFLHFKRDSFSLFTIFVKYRTIATIRTFHLDAPLSHEWRYVCGVVLVSGSRCFRFRGFRLFFWCLRWRWDCGLLFSLFLSVGIYGFGY